MSIPLQSYLFKLLHVFISQFLSFYTGYLSSDVPSFISGSSSVSTQSAFSITVFVRKDASVFSENICYRLTNNTILVFFNDLMSQCDF